MGNRIKMLVVTTSLVAVLAIGGAGAVMAQAPTPTPGAGVNCGVGGGFQFRGAIADQVVTKLLGISRDELHALRSEGKSLVQIAATRNISEAQLVDAIMAYKKTQVDARVAAGKLTQEQANIVLGQMQKQTTEAVNRTTVGGKGGVGAGFGQRGGGAGPGKMNRWATK